MTDHIAIPARAGDDLSGPLVTTGQPRILRLAHHWPWTRDITDALERLALLPYPR